MAGGSIHDNTIYDVLTPESDDKEELTAAKNALRQLFDDINRQNEQNSNKFPYNIEGWKEVEGNVRGRLLYDEEGEPIEVRTYAVGFLCKEKTDTGYSEESYTFLARSDSDTVYVFPGTYGMYNVFEKFAYNGRVF